MQASPLPDAIQSAAVAYDPKTHHRRSIRLKGYDYARPGWYFVTVCVEDKKHLFGEVVDGEMNLNEAGQIVRRAWRNMPSRFPGMILDEHMVMPNHFHGIIRMVGAGLVPPDEGDASIAPTCGTCAERLPRPGRRGAPAPRRRHR